MASEKFIIKGGKELKGTVEIGGYKNAAGAILAATLLTDKECKIDNLPLVEDVFSLLKILEQIGVETSWQGKRSCHDRTGYWRCRNGLGLEDRNTQKRYNFKRNIDS